MKLITFLLIVLTPFCSLNAKPQNRTKVDSLQDAFKKASSDTLRAGILCGLCAEYGNLSGDSALLYGKKGLALAEKSKEKKYIADCLFQIGIIQLNAGKKEEAKINFERCAQMNKSIGYPVKQALALNYLGNIYMDNGAYKQALSYYEQSQKIREAYGDKKGQAGSFGNIGYVYYAQGNFVQALKYYQKSYEIFNALGDLKSTATVFNRIGLNYQSQGDYPKALHYFQLNLKICEKLNDPRSIAIAYNNMAMVYLNRDNYKQGLEYLLKSKKIQEEHKFFRELNNTLTNLGSTYKNLKDYKQALAHYEKSLKLSEEMGDALTVAKTLSNIAIIYTSGIKNYERAKDYFHQCQKHYETMGDTANMAFNLANLSETYRLLGRPQEALRYNQQALVYAFKTGYKQAIQLCYQNRSLIDETLGDYSSALKHYKLHIAYKDSLFNEEKTKEIGKLEGKYEIEKAQEAEKRKQEAEAKATQRQNNLQYLLIFVGVAVFFLGLFFIGRLKLPLIFSEGLVFFAFLMLFEYILIVTEPFLDKYTGGVPIQKLGLNIVLAGIFTPLHRFLEGRLKMKIIKNK